MYIVSKQFEVFKMSNRNICL